MKRRIITTVAVCVFLALVLAVRLSDREKNDNSIPSKETVAAVSYTHLDVYKRQGLQRKTATPSAPLASGRHRRWYPAGRSGPA